MASLRFLQKVYRYISFNKKYFCAARIFHFIFLKRYFVTCGCYVGEDRGGLRATSSIRMRCNVLFVVVVVFRKCYAK